MLIDIPDTMSQIWTWLVSNWVLSIWGSVHSVVQSIVDVGNAFFYSALDMCTGFLVSTPKNSLPDAWNTMIGLSKNAAFTGIASDIVVVGFLITMIDYCITLRSHIETEDIIKMFGRMVLANYLVFHFIELIEGIWTVASMVIGMIVPVRADDMLGPCAFSMPTFSLLWIIISLVYAVVMIIMSFKIITSFFERFLWIFLSIPFGGPAIATVVGTGQFNQTFKSYLKFILATAVEFVAFAILINLLGSVSGMFRATLLSWVDQSITNPTTLIAALLGYLSNICFASMCAGMISKLDGQVSKMLAL